MTSCRCFYKAPLSTDNVSFHCSEKDRILYVAPLLKEWYEGCAEGPFHNFSLAHEAVGWCAVTAWWLLLGKKKSQFFKQIFPWTGVSQEIWAHNCGSGQVCCCFSIIIKDVLSESVDNLLFLCANRDYRSLPTEDHLPISVPTDDWSSFLRPSHALPGGIPLLCQHLQHWHQQPQHVSLF